MSLLKKIDDRKMREYFWHTIMKNENSRVKKILKIGRRTRLKAVSQISRVYPNNSIEGWLEKKQQENRVLWKTTK